MDRAFPPSKRSVCLLFRIFLYFPSVPERTWKCRCARRRSHGVEIAASIASWTAPSCGIAGLGWLIQRSLLHVELPWKLPLAFSQMEKIKHLCINTKIMAPGAFISSGFKKKTGGRDVLQLDEPCLANTISPSFYNLVGITTRKPEIFEKVSWYHRV